MPGLSHVPARVSSGAQAVTDIVERLRTDYSILKQDYDAQRVEIERLTEAHERIVEWSRAYPLTVFPEPDLKKARELLEAGGMTLDAISADAMRHVIEQVAKIARAALEPKP
jgi:hypothetical protein